IPVGRPVDVILETADVIHSFWVPALHGKVEMIPGQPNFIRIEASRAGSFDGECGEFCGVQHAHMRLLVVAQQPADYEAWRQQQLMPAAVPTSQEALHGQEVFNNGACALCHTVRGTVAQGKVAPDLTHIGSRQFIAANSFKNDTANLEAWVTHAQSLKPGNEMPDLSEFNGSDLRALVTYLQQLK
ncbi:MAG: c-type cytochrome, partial [Terriglobales bacterium]